MDFITKPWVHQKKDVEYIDTNRIDYYALLYDMGTGKTKTAIDISRSIFNREKRIVKTLIICPIAVLENWRREYAVHSKVANNSIGIIDGKTKLNGKKVKTAQIKIKLEQLQNEESQILIINTESVGNSNLWPIVMRLGFELLIVDESHRFKGFNATRTKSLHKFTNQETLKYRFILTGSPILQDACDIWAQYYILNPDILGRNFYSFRAKYFYDANAGMPSHVHFPNYVPKDKAYYSKLGLPYNDDMGDLNTLIYKHATRVMKDEVLDLPPYSSEVIEVEFSKEQGRIYKEMRDDLVAQLKNKEVGPPPNYGVVSLEAAGIDLDGDIMSADLAIVKTLRLMQICAGVFTNEEGENITLKTNMRSQAKEILESICANKENKVILWTIFKPTYEILATICEELGIKYTMLTGLQDKDEKQDNIDQFNEDAATQVIIANQAAGGTGCNLTAANYDIYYSWDFSLEKRLQSAARAYRGGQTRNYTSYKLVIPESISERSLEALEAKAANAEDILKVNKELTRGDILGFI